ncbi:MAG: class II fructose-bisphosphate aldolase [Planctomycetaceae bacterium]|nr:class II fructose-bisphosphate aldolase [Planctomycetaceae bacterium]
MLCTLNEVLPHASRNGYAVAAFDIVSDIYPRAILDLCEERRAPVILMALEHDLEGRGLDYIAGIVRAVAPTYTIPVVLHLDHAGSLELIKRCIAAGFSSVMFDGSHLPLRDNIEKTREVVRYAHARGVTVEAELGFVAGNDLEGSSTGQGRLTEPAEVAEFTEKTDVDALAVSIGTAHGMYASKPVLDIERLRAIRNVTDVPLVLHGGSGTPEDQLTQAIQNGISKINIYADMRLAMNRGTAEADRLAHERSDELPDRLLAPFASGLRQVAGQKLELTSSQNRY